ncbi:MAG: flagellar biosynthesis protein FlhF [Bacteroides sp.]|nr:flagellar biosynthesis protein FlhF [Bacteroides sp.]MCM1550030.1 flagellar biosynthesis protein FlhF [Clostridium sp.]
MIIKKFQGPSEDEAVKKAKDELGKDAVIMNVKSVKQKGLKRLFQKDYVEVTAAVDEGSGGAKEAPVKPAVKAFADLHPNSGKEQSGAADGHPAKEPLVSGGKPSAIEERLDTLAQMLERQMQEAETKAEEEHAAVDQNSQMIDLVFQQLKNNEVTEENAREIVNEIDNPDQKLQLDDLLAGVYQKIVLKLGQMKTIELDEDKPKLVFFIGPTGVGKTTTIAKLASKYKLEQKCKLAIVAADTYRVAAVEQIRTYANILSVPIEVIYNAEEMQGVIEKYKDYDLVFVDTAGRSHKNEEQQEDLKKLLDVVRDYNQEIYLVVSATTKYKDLVRITQAYSDISNYRLLFTKTDETAALGNILNIRMLTSRPLSYTTFGQNVPDDIEVTDAQFIAKHLLGGSE